MPYNSSLIRLKKESVDNAALIKALVKKGVVSVTEIDNEKPKKAGVQS